MVFLQKELPEVSVIDLFSRSHPWWEAVCRFYSVVPEEVGTIKGQKISSTALARWNWLRREDRIKLVAYADATSKEFYSDPSLFVSGRLPSLLLRTLARLCGQSSSKNSPSSLPFVVVPAQ